MYPYVEWAVPADPHILTALAGCEGWQTAKNLELNTPFSRQWARQRCEAFVEHDLAERHPTEPAYRLTETGRRVADGEFDSLHETETSNSSKEADS